MNKLVGLFFLLLGMLVVGDQELYYQPPHFPKPTYLFSRNGLTAEKISLGRKLFYDPILSKSNAISCASCHSPYNAFAHTDHALSHGIFDSIGNRNAPALYNLAWQSNFMWDGAITNLDMQALAPISHIKEMGEEISHVILKLEQSDEYPSLFYEAYKDSSITTAYLLKALAQFQLTFVSANAKYDRVVSGKDTFTYQEKNGYKLFIKHCNNCHKEPLFTNGQFANNGLVIDSTLNDYGRAKITGVAEDNLKFKIPSLRNLGFTYPYMHDGRFKRVQDVLNFYNGNGDKNISIDKRLSQNMALSNKDKVDLVAFLITLNDTSFIRNTNFHFPRK